MAFPPSTYTAVRNQLRARFGTPWYYPAQYHQAQYYPVQYYPVQQYTPAPAIPEIVLTTPEGENIHGDAIPRGNDICGYTPDYHYQQIQFYENCEHNLLPVKPHHQRSMIQNAVYEREQHERDELEEQYERDMEFLETDSEWKRMHPEYAYNEVYSLCSNNDTENHNNNNNNNKSAGHADSAPVESQTTTKNKRPYSLTTSWSEISTTNNKRHKTATEKALMREEKQKRERERANLTDKARTARRLSAELKAKMNRSGIGRDEMDKLRKQDEMVRQKLKKYGDEILSLYDEDMSDDDEEDDDDDWEDPMVFEMDEEVESDGDWEIL